MRVLVTGGLGFTGRALTNVLVAAGHDVVVGTSSGREVPNLSAKIIDLDVCDRAQTAHVIATGFDAVCHLAALTQVRASFAAPLRYFDVNATGTANLLHALDLHSRTTGVPARLVFASTGAVYGRCEGTIDEDHTTLPTNPYGTSKLAAEHLIAHQAATGRLDSITMRCFNIAGAAAAGVTDHDTTRIIPKALAVAAGEFDRVQINGDGGALREYTHVLDVAEALAAALHAVRAGTGHQVYNLGSGRPVSIADVLRVVRETTGREVPAEHLPPSPEPQMLMADSSRIRADLRWSPHRSDLRRIVADAWAVAAVGA